MLGAPLDQVMAPTVPSQGSFSTRQLGACEIRFSGAGVEHIFSRIDFTSGWNLKLDAVNPVPEPGTLALLCLGGMMLLMARRRLG